MNSRFLRFLPLLGAVSAFAAEPKAPPAATTPANAVKAAPAPAAAPAPRNDSTIAPSATFDAFRAIVDRNIFNPNRTGRRERSVEEAPPRLDVITLVGTMNSSRGLQAFFDGSERDYRRVLPVGESVAVFKITRIASDSVDVEREGKTVSVRVGQQLRKAEGADWTLVGEEAVRRDSPAAAAKTADPTAPPVIPADADEVTKRMMERRQKQLKQ